MKHLTITLLKFKALKARLRMPQWQVVGLLESLWLFAIHNARDGDLSQFAPSELAAWLEYDGNASEFVEALVATRWLDRSEHGSLVIHDWRDHQPNWLKGVTSRLHRARPRQQPSQPPSRELGGQLSNGLSPLPPNPIQSNQNQTSSSTEEEWGEVEGDLRSAGMAKAAAAVAEARHHGLTAAEVASLLAHWQQHPGAWGVGALYDRICSAKPSDSAESLWPPISESARRSAERASRQYFRAEPRDPATQAATMRENHEIFSSGREAIRNGTPATAPT